MAQPAADDGAFVLAEQTLDASERDRIDVPGVAGDVGHLLHAAVIGCMEAVIHAGGEAQRHEGAVEVVASPAPHRRADPSACRGNPWPAAPTPAITWPISPTMPSHGLTSIVRIGSTRRAPSFSCAGKELLQAAKARVPRIAQIERREESPDRRCRYGTARAARRRLSHPMNKRQPATRQAVGQQEIQSLLLSDPGDEPNGLSSRCHEIEIVCRWGNRPRLAASEAEDHAAVVPRRRPGRAARAAQPAAASAALARQAPLARRTRASRAARGAARSATTSTTRRASSARTMRPRRWPPRGARDSCGSRQLYAQRFAKGAALTREVAHAVSDLQFTLRYRVPFQFSRLVRQHLQGGAFLESSSGRHRDRCRRQPLLRPERLLRRQPLRLRLLQGVHRARRANRCASSDRCSAPTIRCWPTTCAGCARSPASTRCRSTCRAPRR